MKAQSQGLRLWESEAINDIHQWNDITATPSLPTKDVYFLSLAELRL